MSVQITLDQASLANLNKQLDFLKKEGNRSLYSSLIKVAMRIKTTAQLRLKGQFHVDTSRLINSIYLKANPAYKAPGNAETYENDPSKAKTESGRKQRKQSFNSDLQSVSVTPTEIAIGTNVEYGASIENRFPYLSWALQNADIEKSFNEEMRNEMKFGAGVAPQKTKA